MLRNSFVFVRRIFSVALPWQIWLVWLIGVNIASAALLWREPTGWIIIAALILGTVIGAEVFHRLGFTRLLGVMHLPWVPMTLALWLRWSGTADPLLGPLLLAAVITNCLCLAIDTVDVIRYVRGERQVIGTP